MQRSRMWFWLALLVTIELAARAEGASAQFQVRNFRPWSGYAIPNGEWFPGDFDGDGRSDVLHAVSGSDVAHVWTSKADGGFDVSTFRPWGGYAIPNGKWLVGDFDGDGRSDVFHAVQGADMANVWLSRAVGRFDVRQFRPWSGYGMPNGEWRTGDFNGDGRSDVLHAVQGTDYVHVWSSLGDGRFSVSTFRPWTGYAVVNGDLIVGDYDGDGLQDLLHPVRGTDYAHVWTSRGDGTFAVSTFRPWAGYGIPNGVWLAGDYDGDGRSDVLHAVQGADYAHVWSSRGGGTFAVSTFRPWAGYGIPNGTWRSADLDGDGRTDILHAVQGADYANVWLSRGAGSFGVSSFRPWAGYGMVNGVMLTLDLTGDGKADVFHGVQGTDYAHTWLSTPAAPAVATSGVAVESIEVTQAVQDAAHSVGLIADKPTHVRVYLAGGSALRVRGTLRVRDARTGITLHLPSVAAVDVDPAQNGNLRIKRDDLARSLHFVLPASRDDVGVRTLRLSSVRRDGPGAAVPCANCSGHARTARFVPSSHLRVRLVGLSYTTGTPPSTVVRAPSAQDFALARSWLRRAYPVAQVLSSEITLVSSTGGRPTCDEANAQLATLRAGEVAAGTDARTHYYGLVSDAGSFMRGCAAGIPSAPDPTVVASGPAGPSWTGDTDGSYADWYGGHELGHTFGRLHPGFCGESADDLTAFPFPNAGRISHADGASVGLEPGDTARSIATGALASQTSFDVMTYCAQPQWLSQYTYQGVRARLNQENPAFNAAPLAPATRGAPFPEDRTSPRVAHADLLASRGAPVLATQAAPASSGGTVQPGAAPPPTRTGKGAPASITHGAAVPNAIPAAAQSAPASPRAGGTALAPPKARYQQAPVPHDGAEAGAAPGAAAAARRVSFERGAFLSVVAHVNLTKMTGALSSLVPVERGMLSSIEQNQRALLRFYDGANKLLAEHLVWLRESTDVPRGEDLTALVSAIVPLDPKARALELFVDGKPLDREDVPERAPTLDKLRAQRGERTKGPGGPAMPSKLTWEAADGAQDAITYNVEVSSDGGKSFRALALGLRQRELSLSDEQLRALGARPVFRVTAQRGWRMSEPKTVRF